MHGLLLKACSQLLVQGFTNANWTVDVDYWRSMSGTVMFLDANPIAWSSCKQASFSLSSIEVEHRSLANAASEVYWMKALLDELHVLVKVAPVLWCDNLGIISHAANLILHSKSSMQSLMCIFLRNVCLLSNCRRVMFQVKNNLLMLL